jgi:predicted DNA-binding WGR domain protein
MIFFRIDPAKNIRRFWLAHVTPTLLGGWSLIREWGRCGQPGTVKASSFESEEEARRAERQGIRRRELHGYTQDYDRRSALCQRGDTQSIDGVANGSHPLHVVSSFGERMAAGGSIRAASGGSKIKSKRGDYSDSARQGRFDF